MPLWASIIRFAAARPFLHPRKVIVSVVLLDVFWEGPRRIGRRLVAELVEEFDESAKMLIRNIQVDRFLLAAIGSAKFYIECCCGIAFLPEVKGAARGHYALQRQLRRETGRNFIWARHRAGLIVDK